MASSRTEQFMQSRAIMRSPGRQKKMTDARATHPFAQPEDMNFRFSAAALGFLRWISLT